MKFNERRTYFEEPSGKLLMSDLNDLHDFLLVVIWEKAVELLFSSLFDKNIFWAINCPRGNHLQNSLRFVSFWGDCPSKGHNCLHDFISLFKVIDVSRVNAIYCWVEFDSFMRLQRQVKYVSFLLQSKKFHAFQNFQKERSLKEKSGVSSLSWKSQNVIDYWLISFQCLK